MIAPSELASTIASSTALAQSGGSGVSLDLELVLIVAALGTLTVGVTWVLNRGGGGGGTS